MAPTLVTSCTALPPEGALRLWPGKAGSTAPAGEDGFQRFPHLPVRPEPVKGCPGGGRSARGLAKPVPWPVLALAGRYAPTSWSANCEKSLQIRC